MTNNKEPQVGKVELLTTNSWPIIKLEIEIEDILRRLNELEGRKTTKKGKNCFGPRC